MHAYIYIYIYIYILIFSWALIMGFEAYACRGRRYPIRWVKVAPWLFMEEAEHWGANYKSTHKRLGHFGGISIPFVTYSLDLLCSPIENGHFSLQCAVANIYHSLPLARTGFVQVTWPEHNSQGNVLGPKRPPACRRHVFVVCFAHCYSLMKCNGNTGISYSSI